MEAGEAVAVLQALESAGVKYVISGGWGVDALLGYQTRPHDDLDVGVDAERLEEILGLLASQGYATTADQRPARLELRTADGRKVDLHPIAWDPAGNGRQWGFGAQAFDYPASDIVRGRIGQNEVCCISAALQGAFHSSYELRAVDRTDLAALDEWQPPAVRQSGT